MHVIILAGGRGVRLWPISNQSEPKALLKLDGSQSLLQQTLIRASQIENLQSITIVTNQAHKEKIILETKRSRFCCPLHFIIEEEYGDTTIACTAAALNIARQYDVRDDILILPCDHLVKNEDIFISTINSLPQNAELDKITLLGVRPKSPDTNYGYIEQLSDGSPIFIEKPNTALAAQLLASGRCLWNSGMIYARTSILLKEIEEHNPGLTTKVRCALGDATSDTIDEQNANHCLLQKIEYAATNNSIDYSTLQKSRNLSVIACDIEWVDVGNWETLSHLLPTDSLGNKIKGRVVTYNTANCHVEAKNKKIVAIGVEGLTIIESGENILILNKNQASNLKNIYAKIGSALK